MTKFSNISTNVNNLSFFDIAKNWLNGNWVIGLIVFIFLFFEIFSLVESSNLIFLTFITFNFNWIKFFFFFFFSFFFINDSNYNYDNSSLREISLTFALMTFLVSLLCFITFDPYKFNFQLLSLNDYQLEFFNFFFSSQIDGISIFFILLSTFIIPICILVSWEIVAYLREFIICFFAIELFLLIAFSTTNLLVFFIAFESILIPMFLVIGIWGTRFERIKASYFFFFYTLVGSIFFLFNLLFIYTFFGTFDINYLYYIEHEIPLSLSRLLWIFFFLAFAVKIPMFPFHIWLPEAHVEAPTAGSILLAGVLLKLGGYGFLRFSIGLFPLASKFFLPIVGILCFLSITYASLVTLRQLDLKRLIAYSSIAHMNYIVLGLFSFTHLGIIGGIYLMLGHGVVSSALFLLVGVLYDRHHVRLLSYYSGLVLVMPLFSTLFGFFTFTNMAFPGLANFPGELLILIGLVEANFVIALSTLFGLFLSAVYSVWLLNRLIFGNLKIIYTTTFSDISRKEFYSVFPLIVLTFIMGLLPNFFLKYISFSVIYLLEKNFY